MSYEKDQYKLACEELGIPTSPAASGDTLLEAVCRLKQESKNDYGKVLTLLEPVMEHGLQILVSKRDSEIHFDVQTQSKSHCWVVVRDGVMYVL